MFTDLVAAKAESDGAESDDTPHAMIRWQKRARESLSPQAELDETPLSFAATRGGRRGVIRNSLRPLNHRGALGTFGLANCRAVRY